MKKLLLAILLTLISTNAMAEWVLIAMGENANLYADIKSKRKLGNKVKVWNLYDFKAPETLNGKQALSMVIFNEYDCINETYKTLSSSFYSGNMQQGASIGSKTFAIGETTHTPIVPNTIQHTGWEKACGK
jgi:hypothetical protein